jgi:NTE family protein
MTHGMKVGMTVTTHVRSSSLAEALQREPFTLAMSSGFFGFFAHAGALAALLEAGLRPAHVVGSSAGALVTGLWSGGVEPEEMRALLTRTTRSDFWDPSPGLGLLRGAKFDQLLRGLIGARRAEDARVRARISIFNIRTRKTEVRDHGDLADLVRASCAFPLLFQPVRIDGALYADGGILDRAAFAGLGEAERTLFHHLPSKSPWRFSVPKPPQRANAFTVAPHGLPRLGPFRLQDGARAIEMAKEHMKRTLDAPVEDHA